MAKVSFSNMKLKTDTSVKTFKVGENEVEVLQYLPIDDKYSLVMIALQNAEEEGIYNPLKLDMYFNLYLVFMYTNINFTDKQREDLSKLYDILESNEIITQTINLIPEEEYNQLFKYIGEIIERRLETRKSIGGLISKLVADLPKQAKAVENIIENFDEEKFQAVIDFAKAANGGREIK